MENEDLGFIIKKRRELKGISQRKLAKLTKIDNAEISRIERGVRKQPNFFYLKNLSDVLGIDFMYLLKLANYDDEDIEDLKKALDVDYESLPLFSAKEWTQEEHDEWFIKQEGEVDLLRVIKDFRNGRLSEDDFILLMSKGLRVNIRDYFIKEEKDQ